jgi:hypothetical protein
MHLRIDRVSATGGVEPPAPGDIDWCMQLTRSPGVLWRTLENRLVHETQWYQEHKKDEPEAILTVIRPAPCVCGIELVAHSVSPDDASRLAMGMAEAVVDYAMDRQLNDPREVSASTIPSEESRPHVRVMIHAGQPAALATRSLPSRMHSQSAE